MVALIIEEFSAFQFVINNLLKNTKNLGEILPGTEWYEGIYKNHSVNVFFIDANSCDFMMVTEHIFLFKKIELLMYVGYCLSFPCNGDLVLINSAFMGESIENPHRRIYIDSEVKDSILETAQDIGINDIKTVDCKYLYKVDETFVLDHIGLENHCFDDKSFVCYDIAERYNKKSACLCKIRNFKYLNFQDYLLHKNENSLNDLIILALEFILKCCLKS